MPRPTRRSPRHNRRDNSINGPSQRQLRVGEMLRHALSDILRENEIRDSDLEGVSVTITQVKPSPDMRYATVFCEPLGGRNAKAIVAAQKSLMAVERRDNGLGILAAQGFAKHGGIAHVG